MSVGDWIVRDRYKYLKRLLVLMPGWMYRLVSKLCAANCKDCIYRPKGILDTEKCHEGIITYFRGSVFCMNFKKKGGSI
jgi:hypothetical protein